MSHADRLAAVRAALAQQSLDGFVVPLSDAHGSEYVAEEAQALAWLTGFTGSAGQAVVLADRAAVFVDGRYVLQAETQIDPALFEPILIDTQAPADWISQHANTGARIGYDPRLHSVTWRETTTRTLSKAGLTLVAAKTNPIEQAWSDRPAPPRAPVTPFSLEHSGASSSDKRARLAAQIREQGAEALAVTATDAVAWLFNLRGADVAHNPVALAFAIVRADGRAQLFIDPAKLDEAVRSHLGPDVAVLPYEAFETAFAAYAGKRVMIDPAGAHAFVFDAAEAAGAEIVRCDDPVMAMKAVKNATEISGMRAAHQRDGAAVVRFLHWLADTAGDGALDEMTAAAQLLSFRQSDPLFRDTSFDTISGAGPNGAIIHYRVTPETNRHLEPGSLYLVDSGGQYLDGTTDITRTLAIGTPTAQMRRHYSLVLKGYIALATTRFPAKTSGHQLDAIARRPLWQEGLDYGHGTGHGVGCYLNVHEGPQRIAKLPNSVALVAGMIVSNEPGYYRAGAYGIRLENLELVVDLPDAPGEIDLMGFEQLTLAPYERELIDTALLSAEERAWINQYHARVHESLAPLLPASTARWLAARCRPL
ncbi:MAG: aminopeptidase P family protein [Rhodothalassiaceae bacterium]